MNIEDIEDTVIENSLLNTNNNIIKIFLPKEISENEEDTAEDKCLVNNNKTNITPINGSNDFSEKQTMTQILNNNETNDNKTLDNNIESTLINHLFPLYNNKFLNERDDILKQSMLEQYTSYYNFQLNQAIFLNQKMIRANDLMFTNNKELIDNVLYNGINNSYHLPSNWIMSKDSPHQSAINNNEINHNLLINQICSKSKRELESFISPYLKNNVP